MSNTHVTCKCHIIYMSTVNYRQINADTNVNYRHQTYMLFSFMVGI